MKWWFVPVAALAVLFAFGVTTVVLSIVSPVDQAILCLPWEGNCQSVEQEGSANSY